MRILEEPHEKRIWFEASLAFHKTVTLEIQYSRIRQEFGLDFPSLSLREKRFLIKLYAANIMYGGKIKDLLKEETSSAKIDPFLFKTLSIFKFGRDWLADLRRN